MEMIIRSLKPADRIFWQRLYVAYLDFYESEPIATSMDLLWNRLTGKIPEIQGFVIESNGVVIGFTHFHYQLSSWTHTWHCYLEDLFVDPNYRNLGAGALLIQAVKEAAMEMKCSELFWITRSDNQIARNLYNSVANQSDYVRYEIMLHE